MSVCLIAPAPPPYLEVWIRHCIGIIVWLNSQLLLRSRTRKLSNEGFRARVKTGERFLTLKLCAD